jgi:hypothetical protein
VAKNSLQRYLHKKIGSYKKKIREHKSEGLPRDTFLRPTQKIAKLYILIKFNLLLALLWAKQFLIQPLSLTFLKELLIQYVSGIVAFIGLVSCSN